MDLGVRICRVCGCTDDDCSGCIERTGQPCYWVSEDVCSACADADPVDLTFCPVDLQDWSDLASRAGVPFVPSRIIATCETKSMFLFDIEEGEHIADLRQFFSSYNEAIKDLDGRYMVRWSCCGMAALKSAMANGRRGWDKEFLHLTPDDMRAFDIISEFPRNLVSAHLRPWLELKERTSDKGTYGLELRVFVEDDAVKGISAYYPQCPIADDDQEAAVLVDQARAFTERLIAAQRRPLLMPQLPEAHGKAVNAWTVDFVMTKDGDVLLLEGGPPVSKFWGAHPCCFGEGKVEGVALRIAETPA